MNPSERITAEEALNHSYFDSERNRENVSCNNDSNQIRKETYTSTTNRRKDQDYDFGTNLERITKYGKIYNKRKTNYNAIAMIYQSSNNCRINNQYQSKSVGKNNQKKSTFNNNISLEKHHNRDILLRT